MKLPAFQPTSIDERILKACPGLKVNFMRRILAPSGGPRGKAWKEVFSSDPMDEADWTFTTVYHRINAGSLELGTNDGVTYNHPCRATRDAVDMVSFDLRMTFEMRMFGIKDSQIFFQGFGDDANNWNGVAHPSNGTSGQWMSCIAGTHNFNLGSLNDPISQNVWYKRRLLARKVGTTWTTYWQHLVDATWTTLSSCTWSGEGVWRRWDDSNRGVLEKYGSYPSSLRIQKYVEEIYA